jgi:hypothetical protein
LVSSLEFESNCSDDCSVCTPTHWNTPCSVEKSWAYLIGFEIFLDSSFFHVPADNFNDIISLVSDFNLMESISIPVVTLIDVPAVEVVLDIVVMTKVICGVYKAVSHACI